MKKKILKALTVLSCAATLFVGFNLAAEAEEQIIYVSVDGKSSNDGSKESPKTINNALLNATAGQTILLEEGVYKTSNRFMLFANGTSKAPITVKPAVEGAEVILDFSEMTFNSINRGVVIQGDFWRWYDISITGAGDNGMYISGSNNIIDGCQFYRNRDSGLQLGRAASSDTDINTWPSNNLIKNCTAYDNYDDETLGENADGFAAKLTVGQANIFDGCIAYRNSDDGWDLYGKEDSGNIGTVILYNCVSFENGYLAKSYETSTGDGLGTYMTYNTTNGDGIGFKLGGSSMESDVILENCLAFNNKLHGFSDNSNPGFIRMKNCTAVNNCIGLNEDGTVSDRGTDGGDNNKSNNFDLARDMNSYNSYYGLLSYVDNQEEFKEIGESSYNEDHFRGSVSYSIFQPSYDRTNKKENYVSVKEYQDASSYSGDALPELTEAYDMPKDIFVSTAAINATEDVMHTLHKKFRNADGSVNLGDLYKLKDEKLLKFVNGNPIGANLSKTSWDSYNHYNLSDLSNFETENEILVQNAYDAVEVFTNVEAVFQNFEVPVYVNGCEVVWESSNTNIIEIDKSEKISLSSAVYSTAKVYSPSENTKVTLTCTITRGGVSKTKSFELLVMERGSSLGEIYNPEENNTYIISRYQSFLKPSLIVTDSSASNISPLNSSLYSLKEEYEWAESKDGTFIPVADIYTAVPGVFKCTVTATLKSDQSVQSSYTYFVMIGKDECSIDFVGGEHSFVLNSEGFNISGSLTNISGKVYAVVVDKGVTLTTAEEVINHTQAQVFNVSSDNISFNYFADNSSENGYVVYYVVSDNAKKNFSEVRSKEISAVAINTHEEFYKLAQGVTSSDPLTIYNLKKDLDFSNYEWKDCSSPSGFKGTFNGNGHTISNVTVKSAIQKQSNMFYKLENATVMNVNFKDIHITNQNSSGKLIGIIGAMNGGYLSHINMENITVIGEGDAKSNSSTCVGALVGQMIGGINYVDHVTLVNDENQILHAGNKYVGGIVGNIQMDSSIKVLEAYISYCVVLADLGDKDGTDSGGCHGGIVGRIKNDKTAYYLDINNCFYKGTITTKGNYNAGIIGSVESGSGMYSLCNNYSDVVFIFTKEGRLVLDAKELAKLIEEDEEMEYQAYAHKNLNPICGRATTIYNEVLGKANAGSWQEYYKGVIMSQSTYLQRGSNFKLSQLYLESVCEWDFENDWSWNNETGIPYFKTTK